MKRYSVLALLLLASLAYPQEASLQFDQANQIYRSADYQKAAQQYEHIVANGFESAALYYNLGNAYFKLHNIPASLLSFERAKRLAPHDDDITYNLRLANLRVIDKIDPLPRLFFLDWWQSCIDLFSAESWAIAGIAALWSAALCGAVFIMTRSSLLRRISLFCSAALLLLVILSSIGMVQQFHHERSEQFAIVFRPSTPVKSAPDEKSTDLFVVHEGVKIEILDAVGEWKKIRLADGKIGWMPGDSMQII